MPVITDENMSLISAFMVKKPVAKNNDAITNPAHGGKYLLVEQDIYQISDTDANIFENLEVISARNKPTDGSPTVYVPTRQMKDCCKLALKKIADAKKDAKLAKAKETPTDTKKKKK